MKGCKYCAVCENGDIPGNLKELILLQKKYRTKDKAVEIWDEEIPGDMTVSITIYRNKLSFVDNGTLRAERTIKYCPMCGRQLQDE